ncbi:hypothetical protein VPHD528_0183 [Vibrio phage D528]
MAMILKLRSLLRKLSSCLGLNKGGSRLPTYDIVDNGNEQLSAWRITEGHYSGVVYYVGEVSVREGVLGFKTDVVVNPNGVDVDGDLFTEVTGAILEDFLKKQASDCNNWLYRKE